MFLLCIDLQAKIMMNLMSFSTVLKIHWAIMQNPVHNSLKYLVILMQDPSPERLMTKLLQMALTLKHSQLFIVSEKSVPTHLLPNSSSCIDLIFTDQPNMVQINTLWFRKYNTISVFQDSFSHLPKKLQYKNISFYLYTKKQKQNSFYFFSVKWFTH